MFDTLTLFCVFGFQILIASIMFGCGIKKLLKAQLQEKVCTEETIGVIEENVSKEQKVDEDKFVWWYYVVKYYVYGVEYKIESKHGYSHPIYDVGTNVEVRYNPKNHKEFYIKNENALKKKGKALIVFGGIYYFIIAIIWVMFKYFN